MNSLSLDTAKWLVIRSIGTGFGHSTLEAVEMHGDLDLLYFALGKNDFSDTMRAVAHTNTKLDNLRMIRDHVERLIDSRISRDVATKLVDGELF